MKQHLLFLLLLLVGCSEPPLRFETEVLLPFTPVKDQGKSQLCWAYAMLSTIETEHILRGDSIHLSVAYVEKAMEQDAQAPASKRGMGITLVDVIGRYGLVGWQAMPTSDVPLPHSAFMLGCEYTPQEFARSVCAPGEYAALTTTSKAAYGESLVLPVQDNWTHARFLNLPADSLLAIADRAIRHSHAVCWEGDISEWGFDWEGGVATTSLWNGTTSDNHCMAIVGIAHDEAGQRYFIMKNSWGKTNSYDGLMYLSYEYFRQKTVAIFLSKEAL